MVIYLKHPKHGTKVAISDDEAKSDEKNGWERFNIMTTAPHLASVQSINALEPKRRGRPPKAA